MEPIFQNPSQPGYVVISVMPAVERKYFSPIPEFSSYSDFLMTPAFPNSSCNWKFIFLIHRWSCLVYSSENIGQNI